MCTAGASGRLARSTSSSQRVGRPSPRSMALASMSGYLPSQSLRIASTRRVSAAHAACARSATGSGVPAGAAAVSTARRLRARVSAALHGRLVRRVLLGLGRRCRSVSGRLHSVVLRPPSLPYCLAPCCLGGDSGTGSAVRAAVDERDLLERHLRTTCSGPVERPAVDLTLAGRDELRLDDRPRRCWPARGSRCCPLRATSRAHEVSRLISPSATSWPSSIAHAVRVAHALAGLVVQPDGDVLAVDPGRPGPRPPGAGSRRSASGRPCRRPWRSGAAAFPSPAASIVSGQVRSMIGCQAALSAVSVILFVLLRRAVLGCGLGLRSSPSSFISCTSLARWRSSVSQSLPWRAYSAASVVVLLVSRVAWALASLAGSTCSLPSQNHWCGRCRRAFAGRRTRCDSTASAIQAAKMRSSTTRPRWACSTRMLL